MEREAFVSLVTNDSYGAGAIALGKSLRDTSTRRRLVLMITRGVSPRMRDCLGRLWDELVTVEELDSGDTERLALLTRPELGITFSKIQAWKLTQYHKCVFLDADTLVQENVDELFEREELSAAPDVGWPDCFNSGVFVFDPSTDTYERLMTLALQVGSFDGGDQGLFNLFWSDWSTKDIKKHLPFIYNLVPNAAYGYAPAFQQFGQKAKIIHFIGAVKPWQHNYLPDMNAIILSPGTYDSQHAMQDMILRWWRVYSSAEPDTTSSWDPPHQDDPSPPPSPSPPPPSPSPPPPPPLTYYPADQAINHSYTYVPNPPHFIYDVPTSSPQSEAVVVSSQSSPQIQRSLSLDHKSDLDRQPVDTTVSVSYHFHHFHHTSLSQYTPGGYGHLYVNHMYDDTALAPPLECHAPRPESPPVPKHTSMSYASTGRDEPMVTDSVLPYHTPPPLPHMHDVTQTGSEGGGVTPPPSHAHHHAEPAGTIYCDSFSNIQSLLDAALSSEASEDGDNASVVPDTSTDEAESTDQ